MMVMTNWEQIEYAKSERYCLFQDIITCEIFYESFAILSNYDSLINIKSKF